MTFIDFSKAFDSIEHDSMFAILKADGIPPIILGAIKAPITLFAPKLYDQTVIQITSRSCTAGGMQEDTPSPFLFVIVLESK